MIVDRLTEVVDVLWRNWTRTALTAASVAWGIYMLVLLLGLGVGLQNNVRWMFRDDAVNSIWLYRGRTSKAWEGYPVGRQPPFDDADHEAVGARISGVEALTSRFYPQIPGTISWQGNEGTFEFRAVHPDHQWLENTVISTGRFLNQADLDERRKVAVIGREVAREIFGEVDPLGQWIEAGNVMFQVVGTFTDVGGESEEAQIYLPITTAQGVYGGGTEVHQIMFTVSESMLDATDGIVEELRRMFATAHHFDPEDTRAIRVRDNVKEFKRVQTIFTMLDIFVWIVGLGTVAAGVVGVSNISLVSVKERTAEIGLRKALGARPSSILGMILAEALLLTSVSGYAGLFLGVLTLDLMDRFLPDNEVLRNPSVPLPVAFAALAVVIVAGCVAGLIPAVRAASVNPIEALRDE